jgi:asparagine synthase (glutamine-hydrolysing)
MEMGGSIAFASTAAAFAEAGLCSELDGRAVAEFLEYGFVTDARSIYRGVHKLGAGRILRWKPGQIKTDEYWTPPEPDRNLRLSFTGAVEEAEHLFLEAVKLRLDADVPVGALLSGGIDSSLVCWAVAKLGGDITAFTVGTPGDAWDETSEARATAEELGLTHRVLALGPSDAPAVEDLVSAFAEPFACASALGMLAVSQAVKSEATVLLTGDGGDDVFLGYPRHRHYAFAQRCAQILPDISTPIWRAIRPVMPKHGALRRAAHFADYTTGGLGAVVSAYDGLPPFASFEMLGREFRTSVIEERELPWSVERGRNVLRDFIEYERRTRFTGEYLTKVDGSTMYHGLEARAPFLDHELWSFAAALPYGLRLHGNGLKAILREMARRNIGKRVAAGAKRGFGIPVQRWIAGKWRRRVESSFQNSLLERDGWVDAKAVLSLLDRVRAGETAPVHIWHAYVLETWLKSRTGGSRSGVHKQFSDEGEVA